MVGVFKISDAFYKSQTHLISGMVDPIDVKRKGAASIGYWINYMTLNFDPTHEFDLRFFKVKFLNSSVSKIVVLLMWNEEEPNRLYTVLII